MTPQMQDRLYLPDGLGNGNCLAACVASILDLPLWMVPPLEEMFARGTHMSRLEAWLTRMFGLELHYADGHPTGLPDFYIASGQTSRGTTHATVYSAGGMVHDPHYLQTGILSVDRVYYFLPIDQKA